MPSQNNNRKNANSSKTKQNEQPNAQQNQNTQSNVQPNHRGDLYVNNQGEAVGYLDEIRPELLSTVDSGEDSADNEFATQTDDLFGTSTEKRASLSSESREHQLPYAQHMQVEHHALFDYEADLPRYIITSFEDNPEHVINRSNASENHINAPALWSFLEALKQCLIQDKQSRPSIAGGNHKDVIKRIVSWIDLLLTASFRSQFATMSNRDRHLVLTDFFDYAVRQMASKDETTAYLKLVFKGLMAHHWSAGSSAILQQFVRDNAKIYEKYMPSFNQAVPGATISNSKTVGIEGGAGLGDGKVTDASVGGAISGTYSRDKQIAMDSAYSLSQSYTISAGAKGAFNFNAVAAKMGFSASLTAGLTLMNYQEQGSLSGFLLLNFLTTAKSKPMALSGRDGRDFAEIVRKITNAGRSLRGVPVVVENAPYFLTATKISVGSGIQEMLYKYAGLYDQNIVKENAIQNGSPILLKGLLEKYYGVPEFSKDRCSDVNKVYGTLVDGVVNTRYNNSHKEGYTSKNWSLKLEASMVFKVALSDGGVLDISMAKKDAAGNDIKKDWGMNLASLSFAISGEGSLLRINTHTNDAYIFDAVDFSQNNIPAGARRAITRVLETLMQANVLEHKVFLLDDGFKKTWVPRFKQAIESDLKSASPTEVQANDDLKNLDKKQLKHGSENMKKCLTALGGYKFTNFDAAVSDLENKLKDFFNEHNKIKELFFINKKVKESALQKIKSKITGKDSAKKTILTAESSEQEILLCDMIEKYWGVRALDDLYPKLISDAKESLDMFVGKTLDNFGLTLAFYVLFANHARMAKQEISPAALETLGRIKGLIECLAWNVDRRTLNRYSSVMRYSHIYDNRFVFNCSATFSFMEVGMMQRFLGSTVDTGINNQAAKDGVTVPEWSSAQGGLTGKTEKFDVGLGATRGSVSALSLNVSFSFEVYNRFHFPNRVRTGTFIKLVLGAECSGLVGSALAFAIKKATEKLFSDERMQAATQLSAKRSAAVAEQISYIFGTVSGIADPTVGVSREWIFRLDSKYGAELINRKVFESKGSKLSLKTPNLLMAVPPGKLALSFSDNRTLKGVSVYALHGGYMSFFTTWRRVVNTEDGLNQTTVKKVLGYEKLPIDSNKPGSRVSSLYTKEEYDNPNTIAAVADQELIRIRKEALMRYGLHQELFFNDAIALMMQNYLNCYPSEGACTLISGNAKPGQIAHFLGEAQAKGKGPDQICVKARMFLYAKQFSQFSVFNPQKLESIEPTPAQRKQIKVMLASYRAAFIDVGAKQKVKQYLKNTEALDARMTWFLTTTEGRQLLFWLTQVLEAANRIVNLIAQQENFPYVATVDGIPGHWNSKAEQIDRALNVLIEKAKKNEEFVPDEAEQEEVDDNEDEGIDGQDNPAFSSDLTGQTAIRNQSSSSTRRQAPKAPTIPINSSNTPPNEQTKIDENGDQVTSL